MTRSPRSSGAPTPATASRTRRRTAAARSCAAAIGPWIVVIDVSCLASGIASYLSRVSDGRELHVIRVAMAPLHIVYRDGELVSERHGREACAVALTGTATDREDGENVAWDLLRDATGLRYDEELFDAEYLGFALD